MTLTGVGGSLGIGVTQPEQTLHVGGGATVDGNLYVSNNLNVSASITDPLIFELSSCFNKFNLVICARRRALWD